MCSLSKEKDADLGTYCIVLLDSWKSTSVVDVCRDDEWK